MFAFHELLVYDGSLALTLAKSGHMFQWFSTMAKETKTLKQRKHKKTLLSLLFFNISYFQND